eukprot:CAMPEP_0168496982 /NCGR_PEP_ID=MMETSP0228-20121227/72536_1 /TAXON_ID=133427 /ORGANISM="Protoceratium reticulatum, Strain CCCM 535 (=CCMP 1889)" /LENGTH=135 /DNA_ID=CAMNT_0008513855 /DNA_START=25 /DNA_END=430 /DNA_ORIENTATION=-
MAMWVGRVLGTGLLGQGRRLLPDVDLEEPLLRHDATDKLMMQPEELCLLSDAELRGADQDSAAWLLDGHRVRGKLPPRAVLQPVLQRPRGEHETSLGVGQEEVQEELAKWSVHIALVARRKGREVVLPDGGCAPS